MLWAPDENDTILYSTKKAPGPMEIIPLLHGDWFIADIDKHHF
ncbi:hypothetical protein ABID52_003723 [Fictibacillus halophilus]|uniref:Uncharacterized protein n=1 Tax=Fictibacillus halophilus TaxID=1610490 RepID=A0ABV2LNE9_9BACL